MFGKKRSFFLMAGPCVIENEKMLFATARKLKSVTRKLGIPLVFKASYDKANRTALGSFRGPGLEKGLEILGRLKRALDLTLMADVHCAQHVDRVARVADIIQIPAFLCRQTDLLLAAARTGLPVNVKKGQFLSPESVKFIIEKLRRGGCRDVLITERGTSFGYGRLVVDFPAIPLMKGFGVPVVFDATHSVQRPSTGKETTGGSRDVIPLLVYSAVVSGADGIFMEVHPDPRRALSDRDSQYPLSGLEKVLSTALRLKKALEGRSKIKN